MGRRKVSSTRGGIKNGGMSHTALNYRLKTYGEDNLISFIKQKLN